MVIKHKFHAKPTSSDGIKFPSKKEAKYYNSLKLRQASGEIVFFLRQPMFDLGGGVQYRADFVEFHADGTVHFVDVKGFATKEFILKKKLLEDRYPISLEVV